MRKLKLSNAQRVTLWLVFLLLGNLGLLSLVSILGRTSPQSTPIFVPDQGPEAVVTPSIITREELDELLTLPRLDRAVTDEHAVQAIGLYEEGEYKAALREACQSFDADASDFDAGSPGSLAWLAYVGLTECDLFEDEEFDQLLQSLADQLFSAETIPRESPVDLSLVFAEMDKTSEVAGKINNLAVFYFQSGLAKPDLLSRSPRYMLEGDAAVWLLRRLMQYAPQYPLGHLNYAAILGTARDVCDDIERKCYHRNTRESFADVISLDPGNVVARYNYALLSEGEEAEKAFKELARDFPDLPLGTMGMADLHLARGLELAEHKPFLARQSFQQALLAYDRALLSQPDAYALQAGRARALEALRNYDDALIAQQAALEEHPEYAPWQIRLIELYEGTGDFASAAANNRRMLEENPPSNVPLRTDWVYGADAAPFTYGQNRRQNTYWQPFPIVTGGGGYFASAPEIIPRYRTTLWASGRLYLLVRDLFLAGEYDQVLSIYGDWDLDAFLLPRVDAYLMPLDDNARQREKDALNWVVAATYLMLENEEQAASLHTNVWPSGMAVSDWATVAEVDQLHYLTANWLRQAGNWEQAVGVYQHWCPLAADESVCRILLGEALFLMEDYESARDEFLAGIHLVPNRAYDHMALGVTYERLEQASDSLESFAEAHDLALERWQVNPEQVGLPHTEKQIFSHVGDIHFDRGEYVESAIAYRQGIPDSVWKGDMRSSLQGSEYSTLVSNLGLAYLLNGEYDLARIIFEKAIEMDEANPVFHLNLGWSYHLLEQMEPAADAYRKSLSLDPSLFPASNDLGVILAETNHVDAAISAFEQALAHNPDYDLAAYNLGVLLLKHRPLQILQAQTYLGRAIKNSPSLRAADLEYLTDRQVYVVHLDSVGAPSGDWTFVGQYRTSIIGTASFAIGLIVLQLIWGIAWTWLQDTIVEKYVLQIRDTSPVRWILSKATPVLAGSYRGHWSMGKPLTAPQRPSTPWLSFLFAVLIITAVTLWPVVVQTDSIWPSMMILLGYTAFVSLLTHQVGHRLAHWTQSKDPRSWVWPFGSAVSLLLVGLLGYVYTPTLATSPQDSLSRKTLFYFAGPLLNILLGLFLYLLFLLSHLPLFRIASAVNFIVVASSLAPVYPMDGHPLESNHRQLLLVGSLILGSLLAALELGIV